jgi:Ca2+-binding RTX toxin-like protein
MASTPQTVAHKLLLTTVLSVSLVGSVYGATLTGSEGDDTIIGTSVDDVIRGRGGDDTIVGNGGKDLLDAGSGNDTVAGGLNVDQIFTGSGGSSVSAGDGDDFIAAGTDMPTGQYGTQKYDKSRTLNIIDGGAGDDLVFTDNGDMEVGSSIKGRAGSDKIVVGGGGDFFYPYNFEDNIWSKLSGFEVWYLDWYYGLFDTPWTNPTNLATTTFPRYLAESGTPNTLIFDGAEYIAAHLSDPNFEDVDGKQITVYAGRVAVDASQVTQGNVEVKGLSYSYGSLPYPLLFIGGDQADRLIGSAGELDDRFKGNGGDDFFSGGDGSDTAYYSGNASDFTVTEVTYDTLSVRDDREGSPDGTDTLIEVNRLKFTDQVIEVVVRGLYIVGDDNPDQIAGTSDADLIDGKGGDDQLTGEGGNDTAIGGTGSDTLIGGEGSDILSGGDGNDNLVGDDQTSSSSLNVSAASGSPADDMLTGGVGNDLISGGTGDDTAVYRGSFSEYVVSYNSSSQLFTISDKLASRDGSDTLTNVERFKFADGTKLASNLLVNKVDGTPGVDKLNGNVGDDELRGNDSNDTLAGNAGNDLLDGGTGADLMSGGSGDDQFIVDNAGDKVKEDARPSSGTDTVYTELPSYTLPSNVENLVYTGAGKFSGRGNKSLNLITGGPADDILDGKQGGDGMVGKAGNDSYYVDSPADLVNEDVDGGIFDQVISTVTITSMAANVEALTLAKGNTNGRGNALDNYILGSSGLNTIEGGDGADTLEGGLGNDTFYGETAASAGDDADTVAYSNAKKGVVFSLVNTLAAQNTIGAGTDRIYEVSGIENLTGSNFNDMLTGSANGNRIVGMNGNDTIAGLGGADVLDGGGGLDLIDCGSDADIDHIAYTLPTDSPVGANRDQISNFTPSTDLIDFSLIDANVAEAGDQAFLWGGTSAAPHSVWYTVTGSDILVSADVSGDTIPEFELLLKGTGAVQQVDFVY